MKNDRGLSLNAKLLMVQLGSLCLALAIFLVGISLGTWIIDDVYLREAACTRREMARIQELNTYIQEHDLRSSDVQALEHWVWEKRYIYLAVYHGETPILETNGYQLEIPTVSAQIEPLPAPATQPEVSLTPDEDGYYYLQFADGVFRVLLVEFSETPFYDMVVIFALALACLALVLMNLLYNRSITRSIIRLSREVQWVEQGSRDAEIRSDRRDEIGDLARSVERMRRAIIQRMQSEQDAWAANSSLITAISHDVRTPLTALMGYLDLLEGKQYQSEEQMERYLGASREKARQLKELTDELFRYFLVFASPEMNLHPERYDAPILMEQLLGERIIRLEESGFRVQSTPLQQDCAVELDVQYLQRVLDNLFSNIEKHADKKSLVTVLVRLEEDQLILDLANGVPLRPNPAESTKIGLQTCRKIIREMGGTFETQMEEGKFLVEIALPIVKEEAE